MKERILEVAARMINRYGLKKFTMDDIAEELKISKKTIYQYYTGKEEIIRQYFEIAVSSDKAGIEKALAEETDLKKKMRAVVHSTHRFPLTVSLLSELKLYYPDVWEKAEGLKQFKVDAAKKILADGTAEGIFKEKINYAILFRMLQEISDMFVDYDFLIENKLSAMEAIDEALNILFNGIKKQH